MVNRRFAEFQQALRENAAAGAGHDLSKDSIGFPSPDIVGTGAENVGRDMLEHMPHQRHNSVVGRRSNIDDVVAAFEALVSRRMPEQALGAFDDRNDLLARGRSVATYDMSDLFRADQIVARRMVGRDDSARIAQMRGKNEIEVGAPIDLVNRHQRALLHLSRHHGIRPRSRKNEAERNGRLGHRKGPKELRDGYLIATMSIRHGLIVNRHCARIGLVSIKKVRVSD